MWNVSIFGKNNLDLHVVQKAQVKTNTSVLQYLIVKQFFNNSLKTYWLVILGMELSKSSNNLLTKLL